MKKEKVQLEIEIGKYLIITTLSVMKNNRKISRSYNLTRDKQTNNYAEILALENGLSKLNRSVELELMLKPGYLTISINALEKWNNNGFLNKSGKAIKYSEEWERIYELISKNDYYITLKEVKKE